MPKKATPTSTKTPTKLATAQFEDLYGHALAVRNNSYSPYSGFKVAAAVLMDDGEIYTGVNVENASYGATVCAERVAIWKGIAEGAKKIKALLVLVDQPAPWPPCGLCRQVLVEFAATNTPIVLANLKKQTHATTVGELVPMAFHGEFLDR